ncbi:MAG: helix-turn-helix domain-containing protein [Alphaproteobacteria bacterium]
MQPNLLTPDALAARWNITNGTLSQWRWNGKGPQFLKIGRRVLYRIEDVEAFEKQQRRTSTSAPTKTIPPSTEL